MTRAVRLILGVAFFLLFSLVSVPLWAQVNECRLSGTITDASVAAVPNAKISVHNLDTGESTTAQAGWNLAGSMGGAKEFSPHR